MYTPAYGIIETLAPLHIGASAGEETGNLNLIFRDQFTQTGIIPGSSIRGRFRADMRSHKNTKGLENHWYGHEATTENKDTENNEETERKENPTEKLIDEEGSIKLENSTKENPTTEALVKFEYASLVWLPVFCPGQPIVWVTCPRLLKRYQRITKEPINTPLPKPGNAKLKGDRKFLFFNLGFLEDLTPTPDLVNWVPEAWVADPDEQNNLNLVVVEDSEIGIIHDMALYRQTRTKLENDIKRVEHFFAVEALPEGSILVFPIAIKTPGWHPFDNTTSKELYFGGLESIGFGRCHVTLASKEYELCPGNPTF
jgi:CRISPR-associated protein Cmr4